MKQPKDKKCGYKPCVLMFKQFKSTDKYCSIQCKIKDIAEKEINDKVKRFKENINSENVFKYLQDEINKIVRLIDRGHECISSGYKYGTYMVAAGHYFSVGSNKSLRYNLLNIYAQSFSDNDRKGGKGSNYGLRLKEVFGADVRDEIEGLVKKYPYLGLRKEEAKTALAICRQIVRELESIDIIFSTEYRIEVRKKLNELESAL